MAQNETQFVKNISWKELLKVLDMKHIPNLVVCNARGCPSFNFF